MNSEVLKEINATPDYVLKQRAKLSKLESEVEEKGKAAQSFMSHPFWVLFESDLSRLKNDLNAKLLSCNDLKKTQMDKIIQAINMIELFRNNPKGYVDKMKLLLDRKQKLRKEI